MSQSPALAEDRRPRDADRILLWPTVVAVGIPVILILLEASIGLDWVFTGLLGVPAIVVVFTALPVGILIWVIAAIAALIVALRARKRQKWRWVFSAAVLPAVVVIALVQPVNFLRFLLRAGDFIHFEGVRSSYMAKIRALPRADGPRLVFFDWGGNFFGSCGIFYDESDEITLPPEKQSADWTRRADHTPLRCDYLAESFGSHFYHICSGC